MRDEILHYIIDYTDKATFERALSNHNLHYLYRRKKNYLLHKYFGGNELRYSVYMHDLFAEYIPEGAQVEAAELAFKINKLAGQIRLAKRYRSPHGEAVKAHNELVNRYNEIMKGTNKLVDIWNKRHKKIKRAA